jgi:Domain of unknown function (DUF4350)
VVGVVALIGRPDGADGRPLDPRSTRPDGTRALVVLLEELGAQVDVTGDRPSPEEDVALVFRDRFDDDDARRDLGSWVEAGGTLVVADPASPLQPLPVHGNATGVLGGGCDVPALADVTSVDPSGGVTFAVPAPAEGCFEEGGGVFVAVVDRGRGTVVGVGGAGAFVNGVLGKEDNAVLAGALLAGRPGSRVALLRPGGPGEGGESLADLVGDGVRSSLGQLVVAFVLFALWRARRLGRPVVEPQPVSLPASELVVAVGNLLQHAGRRDQAGRLLGDDLRRRLAERLGLPATASAVEVADVAAARTGIAAERLRSVLQPTSLGDDDDLVHLAAETETIRRELEDVR